MEEQQQLQKIRITISSKFVKSIYRVSADIAEVAKRMNFRVRGPFRGPPKVVNIRTRWSPSRDGTNHCGDFKLCDHMWFIMIMSTPEVAKQIISGCNVQGVEIDVAVVQPGVQILEVAQRQESG